MFGIFLAFIAAIFRETGTSIGKSQVALRKESIYTMGFLNLFWAALFFFGAALFFRGEFLFSLASLPTFIPRVLLELLQIHFTIRAIVLADRSTFGFLRIWTIPLLLLVDIYLGYTLGLNQVIGMSLIVIAFIILFINHGIRSKGASYVMFTAVNAVATISLFKYNITHFNSVEAEQGIVSLILMFYLFFMARFVTKHKPLSYIKKPIFFVQSFSMGVASVLMSFAFLFAPASIIATAKRSFTILSSIVAGNLYFHEKNLALKLSAFVLIASGIVLLVL